MLSNNIKKFLLISGLIFFNSPNLMADGYVGDINTFETNVGNNFEIYVEKATRKRQLIGIGYSEKTIGVRYTINTSLKPLENSESNFYTSFILNDWRFEIEESYDILRNNGIYKNSIQIRPGIGMGVDLKSANVTGYAVLNFLIFPPKLFNSSFLNNLSIGINYKYFFMKEYNSREVKVPGDNGTFTVVRVNEDADKYPFTKSYFNFYINYSF